MQLYDFVDKQFIWHHGLLLWGDDVVQVDEVPLADPALHHGRVLSERPCMVLQVDEAHSRALCGPCMAL